MFLSHYYVYILYDMMGQYAVNRQGLRKRNTYEDMIGYLQEGQPTIRYPDRTAKFIRNSIYMTQLDGPDYREMLAQQEKQKNLQLRDILLRQQASKPGEPGIDELQAIASRGRPQSIVDDNDYQSVGSWDGQDIDLANRLRQHYQQSSSSSSSNSSSSSSSSSSNSSSSSSSSSSSGVSSKSLVEMHGSNIDQATNEALLQIQLQEVEDLQKKEDEQRKHIAEEVNQYLSSLYDKIPTSKPKDIEDEQKERQRIADESKQLLKSAHVNPISRLVTPPPQPSSSSSGIPEDVSKARGKSRSPRGTRMVSLSPMHRGKTIEAQSSRSRVRTLTDEPIQGDPASSSRGRSLPPTTVEGGTRTSVRTQVISSNNFATDYMETGLKIEDYYEYWFNKIRSKDRLIKEFELRGIKDYNDSETYKELLAKLINHDRERDNIQGRIEVTKVGKKSIRLHMKYGQ